jgi:hypothetical protein
VFRRTFAVLLAVLPGLALAGWVSQTAPARWLLPCLAFTACTLALGGVIGVPRAAGVIAMVWTAGVVAPSVVREELPLLLQPAGLPGWVLLGAAAAAVVGFRRNAYRRLAGMP